VQALLSVDVLLILIAVFAVGVQVAIVFIDVALIRVAVRAVLFTSLRS